MRMDTKLIFICYRFSIQYQNSLIELTNKIVINVLIIIIILLNHFLQRLQFFSNKCLSNICRTYSGHIQCRTVSSYERALYTPSNMKKKLDVERIPDGSQAALSGLDFIWTSQEYRWIGIPKTNWKRSILQKSYTDKKTVPSRDRSRDGRR